MECGIEPGSEFKSSPSQQKGEVLQGLCPLVSHSQDLHWVNLLTQGITLKWANTTSKMLTLTQLQAKDRLLHTQLQLLGNRTHFATIKNIINNEF